MADIRWLERDELEATDDEVWPRDLLDLLALSTRPELWADGPLDGDPVEESSLPA